MKSFIPSIALVTTLCLAGAPGCLPDPFHDDDGDGSAGASCDRFGDAPCLAPLECRYRECTRPQLWNESCANDEACAATLLCIGGLCLAPNSRGPGDACTRDVECDESLRCNLDPSGAGRCTAPASVPAGQACDRDELCAEPASCSGGPGGVCRLPGMAGPGDRCPREIDCRDGLSCIDGACAPDGSGALGQECLGAAACAAGLNCRFATCMAQGSFREGDRCYSNDDCSPGLLCNRALLRPACAAEGSLKYMAPCDVQALCGPDLICQTHSGIAFGSGGYCLKPNQPLDGFCITTEACAAGLQCVLGMRHSCRPPQEAGGECLLDDTDCATGLRCVVDTCLPLQPLDGPCGRDGDCEDGWCSDADPRIQDCTGPDVLCFVDSPGKGTCANYLERDHDCGPLSHCRPGLVCRHVGDTGPSACSDPVATGGKCDADEDCAKGAACNDGTCGAPLPAPRGGACTESNSGCEPGLVCAGKGPSEPACQPPLGVGVPCERTDQCDAGLVCNEGYDGGRCEPLQDRGGTCLHDRTCLMGFVCETGECV